MKTKNLAKQSKKKTRAKRECFKPFKKRTAFVAFAQSLQRL